MSRLRCLCGISLLVPLFLLCACAEEVASPSIPDDVETDWIVDIRDGKRYKTVVIGDQTWMAENLDYETESGSYCYDGDSDNCDKYGRLYEWSVLKVSGGVPVVENRSVCPQGFHLPTRREWRVLFKLAKCSPTCLQEDKCEDNVAVAKALSDRKSFSLGENTLGFTAKPAGYRYEYYSLSFNRIGEDAYFWSSTERGNDHSYMTHFWSYSENHINAGMDYADRHNAYSVRCVKNSLPGKICSDGTSDCSVLDRANASLVDLRDSVRYAVTEYDDLVWLAENVNFAVDDSSDCYEGLSANCKEFGRLYDFESARKACPGGTHLPTAEEWGRISDVSKRYGMSVLSGGYRKASGKYSEITKSALFWTSTVESDSVELNKFTNDGSRHEKLMSAENIWASVRCVVD